MFEKLTKRLMSPLGKEIVEAMERGDEWVVSSDRETWEHAKTKLTLYVFSTHVRIARIPNVDLSSDERKKLLTIFDQHGIRKATKAILREHGDHTKKTAAATALNLLRLSQHKENQP